MDQNQGQNIGQNDGQITSQSSEESIVQKLDQLLKQNVATRNEVWEREFLAILPALKVELIKQEAQVGPDSWPYLFVKTTKDNSGESLLVILRWLSERGIGLALNPMAVYPDYILTYGMVWNYRERGEFFTQTTADSGQTLEIQHGEQLFVGPPSESYLPSYVRQILRQFLLDQGVTQPKIAMISKDEKNFDLCFSVESLGSPPQTEWQGIAEALSWFLPGHYKLALISDKTVPGFERL